ncbi:MAG: hypothetical protein KBS79_01405, partial [Lachnospiraceae bacterium]|nr:hypothetical protein [Candidatus Minthocola equi]
FAVIAALVLAAKQYVVILYAALRAIAFLFALIELNARESSQLKISWIIFLFTFPGIALVIFAISNLGKEKDRLGIKFKKIAKRQSSILRQDAVDYFNAAACDEWLGTFSKYIYDSSHYPVYSCEETVFFTEGDEWYQDFRHALIKAERFIFLDYFQVERGEVLDDIISVLAYKAAHGVEVRFLYDGYNKFKNLPYNFADKLNKKGIKCRVFNPVKPYIDLSVRLRDHHSLAVIDGNIAYTGSAAIADAWITGNKKSGYRKDGVLKICGKPAESFSMAFLKMWSLYDNKLEDFVPYMNAEPKGFPQGYCIPFEANPFLDSHMYENIYLDIIYKSRNYVFISSDTFIPTEEILTAVKYAAKRGIEVVLLLPKNPSGLYSGAITMSYYSELLEAGVNIYLYNRGDLNASILLSDDITGVVGSASICFSGLFRRFESGAFIYDNEVLMQIRDNFEKMLEDSVQLSHNYYKKMSVITKAFGKICRVFSPLV